MDTDALNLLAIGLALGSVLTGFLSVGRPEWWNFCGGWSEYRRGNKRALLYLIVSATTMLSVAHVAMLVDWLTSPTTDALGTTRANLRLTWHCTIASTLIALHLWARAHRRVRVGTPDVYLWGARDGGS